MTTLILKSSHLPSIRIEHKQIYAFIIALLYAAFFTYLPLLEFKDRHNYLIYAVNSSDILLNYLDQGVVYLIFNEPLWLMFNIALNLVFTPENTLRTIIFIPAFITIYIVFSNARLKDFWWLFIFIFLIHSVTNHIHHLRMSFAAALFILGYFSQSKRITTLCMGVSPFIHFSFMIVVGVYFISRLPNITKKLSVNIILYAFMITTLIIVNDFQHATSVLPARQLNDFMSRGVNVSGGAFALWTIVVFLYYIQGKKFIKYNLFETLMIIVYLAFYFFIPSSRRLLDAVIWLIILAGLELSKWRKGVFVSVLTASIIYSWANRIEDPMLGF